MAPLYTQDTLQNKAKHFEKSLDVNGQHFRPYDTNSHLTKRYNGVRIDLHIIRLAPVQWMEHSVHSRERHRTHLRRFPTVCVHSPCFTRGQTLSRSQALIKGVESESGTVLWRIYPSQLYEGDRVTLSRDLTPVCASSGHLSRFQCVVINTCCVWRQKRLSRHCVFL